MTNDERLEALRLSAKGCGHTPVVLSDRCFLSTYEHSGIPGKEWNPPENPAQLVECIEALRERGCCIVIHGCGMESLAEGIVSADGGITNTDWKLVVVKALAEEVRREK